MGKEFLDTGSAKDNAISDTKTPALTEENPGYLGLSPETIKAIWRVIDEEHGREGSRVRRIIPHKEALNRAGRPDRKTLWRWIRAGTFPAPVQISENKIGFYDDEVSEWEHSRPRVSYAPEAS